MMYSPRVASRLIRPFLIHVSHTRPHYRSFAGVAMAQLKDLRARSGAPINECKKALEQTDGDLDTAMDWLRKHGAAKASSKLAGREAEEGLVCAIVSNKTAAIVQVNSETDFAGRSQSFSELVEHIAKATLQATEAGAIQDDVLMKIEVDGKSVQSAMEEAIVSIRENLQIASAIHCAADEGQWVAYVHGRVTDNTGSSAAVVHVKGASDDVLLEVGKKLAMHVVAARPLYLNVESVPEAAIEKEKDILREQMTGSGKSPEMLEKIVTGKMRKFFEGVCLTEQAHMVVQDNPKVSKALKDAGVEVTHFEFKSVG
jgi:elongation factor Ts